MMTLRCLKILSAFPILALIACSQTRFDDERSQKTRVKVKEESAAAEQTPKFKEDSSNPKPISSESEAVQSPSLTVEDDVIPPEPTVSPAIVAGASLTCIRDPSAEMSVECQAFSFNKKVDLVPDRIYIFDDSIQFWIETSFRRVHVGRYKISVFEGMGSKIPLAISYANGEIVYGETGEEALRSLSLNKNIPKEHL